LNTALAGTWDTVAALSARGVLVLIFHDHFLIVKRQTVGVNTD
jgi:hypothetical protein